MLVVVIGVERDIAMSSHFVTVCVNVRCAVSIMERDVIWRYV